MKGTEHDWYRFSPNWFDEEMECKRCGAMKFWSYEGEPRYALRGANLLHLLLHPENYLTAEPNCL
jgi:hypothetical protein